MIPTCISARARRTSRDACREFQPAVSFGVGGGENVPGIACACATHNFMYLVRSPCFNSNGGVAVPLLKYGRGCAIISHSFMWLNYFFMRPIRFWFTPSPQGTIFMTHNMYLFSSLPLSVYMSPYGVQKKGKPLDTLRSRQIAPTSQTKFSNAFSWMKLCAFRFRYRDSLFLLFELISIKHWFR